MLETLCMRSVDKDPVISCLDEYFACAEKALARPSANIAKARVHAFLATRRKPAVRLREAANIGYWLWTHDAFEPLRNFLTGL
jgi:hypothetical protein